MQRTTIKMIRKMINSHAGLTPVKIRPIFFDSITGDASSDFVELVKTIVEFPDVVTFAYFEEFKAVVFSTSRILLILCI